MRRVSLVVVSLIVSGCSLVDLTPVASTTVTTTTTAGAAPADCTGAEPDLVLLCEAVELIGRHYVDPIPDADLAAAGMAGVEAVAGTGTEITLDCDLGDAVAAPICRAIDEADVPVADGVEAALSTMVIETLDPNSAYLDREARLLAEEDGSGEVEGIGAIVNSEDLTSDTPETTPCPVVSATCRLVVVSTFPGSPARAAGMQAGDQIVSVDGTDILGLNLDEVTGLVRGEAGTDVTVGLIRQDSPVELTMTRAAIEIPVAEWESFAEVGYLRLNLFTLPADTQVRQGLTELIDAGAETIVLDLRDNPGGALQAAVDVAGEFIAEGPVVVTESPEESKTYEVGGDGVATNPDLRLVVVVNRGSASASEVLAGVLKETGRAVVVGTSTFGKNTVQQRFPLGNGGALKLTIARWHTPAGLDFGVVGVEPDIEVTFPPELTAEEITRRAVELAETNQAG